MASCKVISCFSYKGGAGRSTLALNTIPFLADELNANPKNPLVVVDMDIDSCGLTYLFEADVTNGVNYHTVQSLFGKNGNIPPALSDDIEDHLLFNGLIPVGQFFHRDPKSILFLPAAPGVSLGEFGNSYEGTSQYVKEFIEVCKDFDVAGVFLDSAVGDQLTAQWSNSISKYIICCLRPTKQFRDGTKRFFEKFDEKYANKKVIVVPNVVPTEELVVNSHKYPEHAKKEIIKNFNINISKDVNAYIMDLVEDAIFGVPKIDRFMWQEGILDNLAKDELTICENQALKQYRKIASIIAKN